jgi:hypothetical protein
VEVAFHLVDLNQPASVEPWLREEYDLVIALSVLHWLENPEPARRLLARSPRVLFEGHLPAGEEMALLKELGFPHVRLVGYSERLRGMYLATKLP